MNAAVPIQEQSADYWRGRYVRELAGLQGRIEMLQETEELLRRLSTRCCIALQGKSRALDEVLLRLRDAMKSGGQAEPLRPLLAELGVAISHLDDAPVPDGAPGTPDLLLPGLLRDLLGRIRFDEALQGQARALGERLEQCETAADLDGLIEAIAQLVNLQSHGLQNSLLQFEAAFGRINSRLGEMFEHVSRDAEAFEQVQESGRTLERQLLGEVGDLGEEVRRSDSLSRLQQQVEQRLQRIASHVEQFRVREREQSATYQQRARDMRERIRELEIQASSMQTAMRQQKRKALIDPLTGIPNRLAYRRRVGSYFQRAELNGWSLCLAIWDIDHFKQINDSYGHKAGDRALRLVGRKLAGSVRDCDFVARYGGEEFVMLLENSSRDQAVAMLDELRRTIAQTRFHHQGQPVKLTISCGVTELSPGDEYNAAFERADAALYEAKRGGRNRISSA